MSKKNSIMLITFSLVGILISIASLVYSAVFTVTNNITYYDNEVYFPTLMLLVCFVLFLAATTTQKSKMIRVLGIITASVMVAVNLIITISEYTMITTAQLASRDGSSLQIHSIIYFAIALLMLVASIFTLIYLINGIKSTPTIYLKISSLSLTGLVGAFFITYLVFTIFYGVTKGETPSIDTLLTLVGYTLITTYPLLIS